MIQRIPNRLAIGAIALAAAILSATVVDAQPRRHPRLHPGPLKKEERKELVEEVRARAKERREHRQDRRQDRRQRLRAALKEVLKNRPLTPVVTAELRIHARRVAELERLRELAGESDNAEAIQKIDELLLREQARYDEWMKKLPSADGAAPTATGGTP